MSQKHNRIVSLEKFDKKRVCRNEDCIHEGKKQSLEDDFHQDLQQHLNKHLYCKTCRNAWMRKRYRVNADKKRKTLERIRNEKS